MGSLTWSYQIFCLQLLLVYSHSYSKLCSHDQSSALLHFKQFFSFKNSSSFHCFGYRQFYPKMTSWKEETDCCSWDGVTCDMATGHVLGLDLSCSWLYGSIPSNSSIFFLSHLQKLNLAFNDFNYSNISPGFSKFPGLTHLNLSFSNFSGQLPSEISHLSKLESLDLSWNPAVRLEKPVWNKLVQNFTKLNELILSKIEMSNIDPGSFMNLSSSLTSLSLVACGLRGNFPESTFCQPNLQFLALTGNDKLSGVLPKVNWSSSLRILDLSFCNFTGSIPISFGNLTQLTHLILRSNNFLGHIPSSISNLELLFSLDLSGNKFSGNVEFYLFAKLKSLRILDLSNNKLSLSTTLQVKSSFPNLLALGLSTCNLTELPDILRTQRQLELLEISDNRIHGRIPSWMSDVGKDTLFYLNLSHNFLTGIVQLPWKNLVLLDLRSNLLQGSLMVLPPFTRFFSVSSNQLTGEIPSPFCNLSSIEYLDLSNNSFSGIIPQNIGSSNKLLVLNLRMNNFNGNIPQTFAKSSSLTTLNLNGNKLGGSLPPSLVNCSSLEVLDVGNNVINDTFPDWLADLPELQVLILRSNRFHGPIGKSNTRFPFPKLRILDLSHNKFSGVLPTRYFQNFKAMMHGDNNSVELEYIEPAHFGIYTARSFSFTFFDYYSTFLTVKGNDIDMERIITTFTTIDLSSNRFQGRIPEVAGYLNSLKYLNFSHNNLTGGIPPLLANLTALESLDLSSNNLVWKIPVQLTNLTSLSVLNLSYNQLEGPIPLGPQFNTFPNSSYIGNLGLCGFPLSEKCSNGEAPASAQTIFLGEDDGSSSFDWKIVMMGYASGLVIGLSIGYMVFATGRPQWFLRMVERMQCKRPRLGKKKLVSAFRWFSSSLG